MRENEPAADSSTESRQPNVTYTDAALLDALREAAAELGHAPTMAEYRDLDLDVVPSADTISRRLGGWTEAKRQAGLIGPVNFHTTKDGYEVWTDTHAGETYRVQAHRLVAVAEYGFDAVTDKHVHHGAGAERSTTPFDNRPSNLRPLTAGDHQRLHRHGTTEAPSDDELLVDLRRVEAEADRWASAPVYNERGRWSAMFLADRFGSWNAAREAAGLAVCPGPSDYADAPWRDAEALREAYERAGSAFRAGLELGCSSSTVDKWMGHFGIEKFANRD